jgi:hypothetical protein
LPYRRKTGIHRSQAYGQSLIPHCLAYRDSFPSCSRRCTVRRPNILDWLQNKPDSESCQQSPVRWYLFSIQQFRRVCRLVRHLHPLFVDKVCRYMQQGQCKSAYPCAEAACTQELMPGTTRNRFNGVWRSTKGEGLLVRPDRVYGTYFSYSDHRRNCIRA